MWCKIKKELQYLKFLKSKKMTFHILYGDIEETNENIRKISL